jgi:hypothetical protein
LFSPFFLALLWRRQALHAAAVAGEVPGVGEAFGVARFQGNGQAENFADARHVLHALEGFPFFSRRENVLLDLGDGFLELAHQPDLLAAEELIVRRGEAGLGVLEGHGSDAGQRHALTERAFVGAFETQDQTGAQLHQEHAPAQEVAHGPGLPVVEVADGQDAQAHQFAQEEGVGNVVGVFEAVVLMLARGVGQHHG